MMTLSLTQSMGWMVGPDGLEPSPSTVSSDRSSKSLQQDTILFNNLTRNEPTLGDTVCLGYAPPSDTSIDTRLLGLRMVQVHFAVVLTLNDTPHAEVASCLGLDAWHSASLPYADTQRIDADEKEDQGNPRGIEDLFQSSNPFAPRSVIGRRLTPCPSCPLQFVLPLNYSSSLRRGRSGWTRSISCASRGKIEARISPSMHGHLYSAEFHCVNLLPASSFIHVTMGSSLSKSLDIRNSDYPSAKTAWFRSGLPPSRFGRRVEWCIFPAPARCFPSFGCL